MPARPPLNTAFSYKVKVRNTGQGAVAWSTISIYPGSVPEPYPAYCGVTADRIAFGQVPALAAGASAEVTLNAAALTDANAHLVYALVDWTCDRTEDSENDNYGNATVYAAAPDLEVAALTWEPDPLYPGQELTYHVTVSNTGTLASGPVNLRIYSDTSPAACNTGGYVVTTGVPGLAIGEAKTITVGASSYASAGNHTISAFVDATCQAIEEDDLNNVKSAGLSVSPPVYPNLQVTGLSPAPAEPYARESFTYSVTVTNAGDGPSGYSLLGLRLDATPAPCGNTEWVNTAWVPQLNGHTSTTVSVASPPFTSEGAHTVYAVIDALCAIPEDTESDNLYGGVPVIVQPPRWPDWEVTSITPVPLEPKARSQFSYSVGISNHGTAASPAVDVAIYTDSVAS